MEPYMELLKQVNIAQIFLILGGIWIFYNRLDKKIEKLDEKLCGRIDKVEGKLEKVENRITLLEHDMVEIKTILRMKECCMIKDDSQVKKAE